MDIFVTVLLAEKIDEFLPHFLSSEKGNTSRSHLHCDGHCCGRKGDDERVGQAKVYAATRTWNNRVDYRLGCVRMLTIQLHGGL